MLLRAHPGALLRHGGPNQLLHELLRGVKDDSSDEVLRNEHLTEVGEGLPPREELRQATTTATTTATDVALGEIRR